MMDIIFLDIDGVMQPFTNTRRIKCNCEEVVKYIAEKLNDDSFYEMNEFDVAAVYLDWEKEAIDNLKTLIKERDAKIVLSTGWRYMGYENLVKLFRIHDLDQYIIGETPRYEDIEDVEEKYKEFLPEHVLMMFHFTRVIEILEYVNTNHIENYVVLDDINMTRELKEHFVHIEDGYFHKEYLKKALEILK